MNKAIHRAFIGLGSNLSGPLGGAENYIELAIARLSVADGLLSLRRSGLYQSAPWGNTSQDDFLNAVAEVECLLEAEALLDLLLETEADLGRIRNERWGPRVIDLDLLSFDDLQLNSERLILPHPHMHERAFVLIPLLELEPDFEIPGLGAARECLAAISGEQAVRLV